MKVEANPDHAKAAAFFRRILSGEIAQDEPKDVRVLVIAHIVDSAIAFIPAIADRFTVQAFLGKPSSIQDASRHYLQAAVKEREYELDKKRFSEVPHAIIEEAFPRLEDRTPPPVVLLDIGGYFVPGGGKHGLSKLLEVRDTLTERGYRLAGIVEDTMNGHKRYQTALGAATADLGFDVYSVATSPLKKPENHLVGVAVTFSIEAILRQSNIVLQSRRAGVIGFGSIGRSVAHALRGRGIPVSICETDSVKLAQAAAQGFKVYHYARQFDEFCRDLNLIVSATGAGAGGEKPPINEDKVRDIQNGTFVASVTSADDEIGLEDIELKAGYRSTPVSYNEDVRQWVLEENGRVAKSFYLMLNGNAVNFKHEGVIGPAIQLLQGEIARSIVKLLEKRIEPAASVEEDGATPAFVPPIVHELNVLERTALADMWLDQYLIDDDFRS